MMRIAFSLLAAGVLLTASPLHAATFVVSKVADTNDGVCDADCSLREAIAAANASPSDDTIVFDADLFGSPQTITLSGTEIVILAGGSLVIEGPGANLLTLDGNDASRILTNGVGANTIIRDIRFTRGNGVGALSSGRGGAIYNAGGTLLVERLVLEGNSATNGGSMNNAAAGSPAVPATQTIVDSLFIGNTSSGSGGAIQNFSTSSITIVGSTFTGNTSNGAIGGGAAQLNGSVVIANSTFSGNSAPAGSGGGISSNSPSILIANSTFTGNSSLDNGGGLHRATDFVDAFLRNSIFAGNSSVNGDSPDVTANVSISSLGNNIVGVAGPTAGWVGSDLLNQDPLLSALADNGGPTPTHRLGIGSPAINAGQDCVVTQSCTNNNLPFPLELDQRGFPRRMSSATDIGAYELQSPFIGMPIYDNGPLSTGTLSNSGQAAPAGYEWSEVQNDTGDTDVTNGTAGFTAAVTEGLVWRIADDFTVPMGEVWRPDFAVFYAYQTSYAGAASPVLAYTLRVWDGRPDDPGSSVLCGDEDSNRLDQSFETGLYRIFNSAVPAPGTAPGTARRIWASVVEIPADCAGPDGFAEGTYWLDWNSEVAGSATHFAPSVTRPGQRFREGDNGLQRGEGGTWRDALDGGNPASAPDVPQDFPFLLFGEISGGADPIFADGFEQP